MMLSARWRIKLHFIDNPNPSLDSGFRRNDVVRARNDAGAEEHHRPSFQSFPSQFKTMWIPASAGMTEG